METNQESSAEKFFSAFGKKVDQFILELKDAANRAEVDMTRKFDELREAAEKIKKEAENKQRWKEIEDSLRKAGEELNKAFSSLGKKGF